MVFLGQGMIIIIIRGYDPNLFVIRNKKNFTYFNYFLFIKSYITTNYTILWYMYNLCCLAPLDK